jgi:hypothetical protein
MVRTGSTRPHDKAAEITLVRSDHLYHSPGLRLRSVTTLGYNKIRIRLCLTKSISARLLMSIGAIAAALSGIARAAPPPELILFHGRVLTVDSRDSVAQALAIRDGKILAVGSDEQILRLADAATRRIDLHGRTATPGLIDSHAHIADAGVEQLYHVHLGDAATVAEVAQRVQAGIAWLNPANGCRATAGTRANSPSGAMSPQPILTRFPESRVVMHTATAAFDGAHLAKSPLSQDPPAGTIDRDAQGRPTGVLKESAMDAVLKLRRRRRPAAATNIRRTSMTCIAKALRRRQSIDNNRCGTRIATAAPDMLSEHVCVLWYAGTTPPRRGRSLLDLELAQAADRSATAVCCLRREDIHGWQRRCAHRVDVSRMAQEFHRRRPWKFRLPLHRS